MSITGFVTQYIPPSRWWRRAKSVTINIWPEWLAQALCPHERMTPYMWGGMDLDSETGPSTSEIWERCEDCHKCIVRENKCKHEHQSVAMYETVNGVDTPVNYSCDDCGQPCLPVPELWRKP